MSRPISTLSPDKTLFVDANEFGITLTSFHSLPSKLSGCSGISLRAEIWLTPEEASNLSMLLATLAEEWKDK